LENIQSSSTETELLAQSAQLSNSQELLSSGVDSFYLKIVFFLLIIAGIPLFPKNWHNYFKISAFKIWILLVLISTFFSIDHRLSNLTICHLFACGICLLVGEKLLKENEFFSHKVLFPILSISLFTTFMFAFQQHYGGLEDLRKSVLQLVPEERLSEEFLRRINSTRVYGTMIYPNSLAGLIMLLLPACLCALWNLSEKIPQIVKMLAVGILGYMGVASLYWTKSKTAWLIVLLLAVLTIFIKANLSKKIKTVVAILLVCMGTIAFFTVHSDYFKRGATSVTARFDYWQAAVANTVKNPIIGTGPGTFGICYQKLKKPESEMARLCHNDYLEQFTDSGIPAGLAWLIFILAYSKKIITNLKNYSAINYCIALGLLAFILQAFTEFSLYIPAIALPFFTLLGGLNHVRLSDNNSVQ